MTLAAWQHDFRTWLTDASEEAARRIGPHAMRGLSVYQNNYRGQLVECLEHSFPQVRTLLGEDAFLQAAATHIGSHPPHAWTLDAYACDFGDTLRALYPHNPDLHELAWIENALTEAFVAHDAKPLPLDTLASIDWDAAQLRFAPSLRHRTATTNADSIWSAMAQSAEPPDGEMLAEAGGLLVWRRQFVSCLKRVDAIEYEAVLHLQKNASFATLCDVLVERLGDEHGVAKAGALLAGWLGSELIVAVDRG
ncbi:putative DNA-binding domain-containing protein [Paraburkholderia sp. LEh10]|uniref:HvfC/BufC N-terminal domain-containing protein n=1 Tax=Paraburkholderia sp. LEh10 TaxID=2821353 RepID=UPI001AEA7412|nr:DNA-binding domain-containing protein [Paraburkholderia sp. LEh10]MBP0588693.1 putative DNA-binding domain-containing protein [Paraburkholderia sp. LEh10]